VGRGPAAATPAELARLPWLALNTFYRDEVELMHAGRGQAVRFAIRPRLSTDHLYALCNAVRGGLGAGIASTWAVADDLAAGRLVQLAPDWTAPALPISLVHPPGRFPPARLRAFIALMRDYLPQVPGVRPPSRPPRSV
jgi:DNA-binding transcriptional LysR family regulator